MHDQDDGQARRAARRSRTVLIAFTLVCAVLLGLLVKAILDDVSHPLRADLRQGPSQDTDASLEMSIEQFVLPRNTFEGTVVLTLSARARWRADGQPDLEALASHKWPAAARLDLLEFSRGVLFGRGG